MPTRLGAIVAGVCVFLGSLAVSARADEAPPEPGPSLTWQRGMALFKRQDYLAASIELHKVLDRKTQDNNARRLEAQLYLARALDGAGFKIAALGQLRRVLANGPHAQTHNATRGVVMISRDMPGILAAKALARGKLALDHPSLADVRDEAKALVVKGHLLKTDLVAADTALQTISKSSPHYQSALLELGLATARKKGWKEAALFFDKLTDPSKRARVELVTARIAGGLEQQYDRARKLFAKVAASKTKWAPMAMLEGSLLEVRQKQKLPVLTAVPEILWNAVYYDYCNKGALEDALAGMRAEAPAILQTLSAITRVRDAAERFTALRKAMAGEMSERARDLVRQSMSGDKVRARFQWHDYVSRELGLMAKADAAWKKTPIAARVLQELMLMQSLAKGAAGKLVSMGVMKLTFSLNAIVNWKAKVPTVTDPAKPGLWVTPTACPKGTPMHQGSASAAKTGSGTGAAPVAKKGGGCAGCATGSGGGSVWLLALAVLLFARRRR